ncbi:hypothetical protein CDL12_24802 [Handroanthus impetiginosus]|uniref:Uncharacterized protein n=1 Tax=Handroanthus impetiginosus TaxID=429701 RepID=A0A2G9GBM4_9LAMI|nr:hypothetical protein CDL12_24802 [Handroanthus impetiginosus]
MEQVCLSPDCYRHQFFPFQELLDWRFFILGDYFLVSFFNCT